jgi:hypothetical protein
VLVIHTDVMAPGMAAGTRFHLPLGSELGEIDQETVITVRL